MEIVRRRVNFIRSLLKRQIDIKIFVLFSMFCIFPFLVIPNDFGSYCFPRYVMLVFLSLLSLITIIKEKEVKLSLFFLPLALYLLCTLISSITAYNTLTAWMGLFGVQAVPVAGQENTFTVVSTTRFTGFVTILCCVILYLTAYKAKRTEKLINAMIFCAALVGFISLLQYFGIDIITRKILMEGTVPYSTMGNPNFLATYTALILPAAIYQYIKEKRKLWLLCTALIYTGMLLSFTRGVWLSFGISIVIMSIYYIRKKSFIKSFGLILLILTIVTVVLLPIHGGFLYQRALSIGGDISAGLEFEDSAGSGRMYIWKETMKLLPDHWVLGVGPDNLIYEGISLNSSEPIDKAHNIYLETAVTMGIPALLFYLAFLSFFLLRRWKNDKDFMFFSMISTYLMQGFFNIDVIMVLPLFWIVLGLYQAHLEEDKVFIQTGTYGD